MLLKKYQLLQIAMKFSASPKFQIISSNTSRTNKNKCLRLHTKMPPANREGKKYKSSTEFSSNLICYIDHNKTYKTFNVNLAF